MEALAFTTEDGVELEGELRLPGGRPRAAAVLCHPHPRQGGSKDHPLLWAIRAELARRGFAVLSFNFRGVMGSGGSYGGGAAEVRDVRAAVGDAARVAPGPVLVAGWSFGAHVALREAVGEGADGPGDERVGALALVGMPLGDADPDLPPLPPTARLATFERPALLLAGEADPFCPIPDLRGLARRLPGASVHVVPGTDHFFWKREREAAAEIGEFAERVLATGSPGPPGAADDAP